ncbi:MAG: 4'-phosphopantetheinyl transferase superfamily protein [Gemmatimonadaceae bacterium]
MYRTNGHSARLSQAQPLTGESEAVVVTASSEARKCVGTDDSNTGVYGVYLRPRAVPRLIAFPLSAHAVALRTTTLEQHHGPVVTLPLPVSLELAAPRRMSTFLAGRYCAMRALHDAGARDHHGEISRASDGAPCWPDGFVGSITHTDEWALAVAAHSDRVRAIGVDCEHVIDRKVSDEIAHSVLPEIGECAVHPSHYARLTWEEFVTVAFSAKESLFKCLHPLTQTFFDFSDASVVYMDVEARRLMLRLTKMLSSAFVPDMDFEASFSIDGGIVTTLVTLGADATRLTTTPERNGNG